MENREQYIRMIDNAKNSDYLGFKENFDAMMVDKLDLAFEAKTKEIYGSKLEETSEEIVED